MFYDQMEISREIIIASIPSLWKTRSKYMIQYLNIFTLPNIRKRKSKKFMKKIRKINKHMISITCFFIMNTNQLHFQHC